MCCKPVVSLWFLVIPVRLCDSNTQILKDFSRLHLHKHRVYEPNLCIQVQNEHWQPRPNSKLYHETREISVKCTGHVDEHVTEVLRSLHTVYPALL